MKKTKKLLSLALALVLALSLLPVMAAAAGSGWVTQVPMVYTKETSDTHFAKVYRSVDGLLTPDTALSEKEIQVSVSADSLDFGSIQLGKGASSARQTLTLTNTGTKAVSVFVFFDYPGGDYSDAPADAMYEFRYNRFDDYFSIPWGKNDAIAFTYSDASNVRWSADKTLDDFSIDLAAGESGTLSFYVDSLARETGSFDGEVYLLFADGEEDMNGVSHSTDSVLAYSIPVRYSVEAPSGDGVTFSCTSLERTMRSDEALPCYGTPGLIRNGKPEVAGNNNTLIGSITITNNSPYTVYVNSKWEDPSEGMDWLITEEHYLQVVPLQPGETVEHKFVIRFEYLYTLFGGGYPAVSDDGLAFIFSSAATDWALERVHTYDITYVEYGKSYYDKKIKTDTVSIPIRLKGEVVAVPGAESADGQKDPADLITDALPNWLFSSNPSTGRDGTAFVYPYGTEFWSPYMYLGNGTNFKAGCPPFTKDYSHEKLLPGFYFLYCSDENIDGQSYLGVVKVKIEEEGASTGKEEPTTGAEPVKIIRQDIPKTGTAYESKQTVELDGKKIELPAYALKDANGNPTNYVRLRDLAQLLSGSAAQFDVTWSAADGIGLVGKHAYDHPNGTEGNIPFTGDMSYNAYLSDTKVDGAAQPLTAFTIEYQGGGHTYYQLRDLGRALGFNVGWASDRGIFIETDKPYSDAD